MKTALLTDRNGVTYLQFWCPGCDEAHGPIVARPNPVHPFWDWNGSRDQPTLSPSIRVSGTRPITNDERDRILAGQYVEPEPRLCHSFVRNGQIEFLGDCTHHLKGQTVPIPDWPYPEDSE